MRREKSVKNTIKFKWYKMMKDRKKKSNCKLCYLLLSQHPGNEFKITKSGISCIITASSSAKFFRWHRLHQIITEQIIRLDTATATNFLQTITQDSKEDVNIQLSVPAWISFETGVENEINRFSKNGASGLVKDEEVGSISVIGNWNEFDFLMIPISYSWRKHSA